jgi:hypothetical protein
MLPRCQALFVFPFLWAIFMTLSYLESTASNDTMNDELKGIWNKETGTYVIDELSWILPGSIWENQCVLGEIRPEHLQNTSLERRR